MPNTGFRFEIVTTNKKDGKSFTSSHDNLKTAASVYAMAYLAVGESVKLFIVLGPHRFEYIHKIKKFETGNKDFVIHYKGCLIPLEYSDVNPTLDKVQELANAGMEDIVIMIRDNDVVDKPPLEGIPSLTDFAKENPPRELMPYQKNILANLRKQMGPKDEGKPDRKTIISKDEITNLTILLNSKISFEDFLSKI